MFIFLLPGISPHTCTKSNRWWNKEDKETCDGVTSVTREVRQQLSDLNSRPHVFLEDSQWANTNNVSNWWRTWNWNWNWNWNKHRTWLTLWKDPRWFGFYTENTSCSFNHFRCFSLFNVTKPRVWSSPVTSLHLQPHYLSTTYNVPLPLLWKCTRLVVMVSCHCAPPSFSINLNVRVGRTDVFTFQPFNGIAASLILEAYRVPHTHTACIEGVNN